MTSANGDVRHILAEIVGSEVVNSVGDEDRIFQNGVVDSLHLVELVAAIESRFGFKVHGHELQPDNFASVSAMCSYVDRKLSR